MAHHEMTISMLQTGGQSVSDVRSGIPECHILLLWGHSKQAKIVSSIQPVGCKS